MLGQFVASWVCGAIHACQPAYMPPRIPQNPQVTIYHTVEGPHLTTINDQLTFDQIVKIQLRCDQKQLIINAIEKTVGTRPVEPELLSSTQQQLYSVARSKIWQLRTFCP